MIRPRKNVVASRPGILGNVSASVGREESHGPAALATHLEGRHISLLNSRFLPPLLGVLTSLAVWWVWGSLSPISGVHDETSYLLQARLFADGRWSAPSPPIPEFFEQFHVLVTPVFASKYPPGHSLVLVPGIWLGLPALVPLVLTGLTGALFFSLAKKLAGGGVALLAWALWLGAPGNLAFRSTYLSEVTTSALWLIGWWALWRWREEGRPFFLVLLAICVGWSAITRPLTALVFGVTAGAVVVQIVLREPRRLRQLAAAGLVGAAVLSLVPLWSSRTTGNWRLSPLALYTRQYMPYDVLGFGPSRGSALRQLPPDLDRLNNAMKERRDEYRPSTVPETLGRRIGWIAEDVWGERLFWALLIGFTLGVPALRSEGMFALVTSVLLVLSYLAYYYDHAYSYDRGWSVYYLEIYPVLAFVTAAGLWRIPKLIVWWMARFDIHPPAYVTGLSRLVPLGLLFLIAYPAMGLAPARHARWDWLRYQASFRERVESLPGRTVVFVRYATRHDGHRSLVTNWAELDKLTTWVVYDRGADNSRLLRMAPDRTPYLYEERRGTLLPLTPDSASQAPAAAELRPL